MATDALDVLPRANNISLGKILSGLVICLALGQQIVSFFLTLYFPPEVWVGTLFDDAYYYLGIARHLSAELSSSFAPPFQTNGYQPLWQMLLAAVSFVVRGDRALLAAGTHLLVLAILIAFLLLSRRHFGAAWPAAVTILCFPDVFTVGMETVLLAPLAIAYFNTTASRFRGILAALLFLSRLDALGLVLGREVVEFARTRRVAFRHHGPLLLTVAVYAGVNQGLFGIPLPISGLAKSVGEVPGLNIAAAITFFSFAKMAVIAGLMLVPFMVGGYQLRLAVPIGSAVTALVASSFYYSVFSTWPLWYWYMWPTSLLFYFVLVELTFAEIPVGRRTLALVAATLRVLGMLLLSDYFVSKIMTYRARYEIAYRAAVAGKNPVISWDQRNVSVAAGFRDAPSGTTFAMGDRAGGFGFFLDDRFRLIQTEGLVASRAYVKALRDGDAEELLTQMGVDFFIMDRGRYRISQGIFVLPEPGNSRSPTKGVMVLCFPVASRVGDRNLSSEDERLVFRWEGRVPCPQAELDWVARDRTAAARRWFLTM